MQGPPPPYLDKIQKNNSFFSRENVPKSLSMQGCVQISNCKDQSKELLLSMFPKLCFLHLVTGLQLGCISGSEQKLSPHFMRFMIRKGLLAMLSKLASFHVYWISTLFFEENRRELLPVQSEPET